MLWLERSAVHGPYQQNLRSVSFGEREAASVVVPHSTLGALVWCPEHQLDRGWGGDSSPDDVPERYPGPLGRADGLDAPGHVEGPWLQVRPTIARALHRHRQRSCGAGLDLGQGQLQRGLDEATHLEPVGLSVDEGHIEVSEQVVHPDRGDVVTQGLEGHALVAVGQGDLGLRVGCGIRHAVSLARQWCPNP